MEKVIVARIDGKRPREIIDAHGKPCKVSINPDGIPMYILPRDVAIYLCALNPEKYRLYRSEPGAQKMIVSGKLKWVEVPAYDYKKVCVASGDIDPENGEILYTSSIEWEQLANTDTTIIDPTEGVLTGKKPAKLPLARELELEKVSVEHLKENVSILKAEIEELKKVIQSSADGNKDKKYKKNEVVNQ